ncbi:MAG: 30S ribosomal protein S5 [Gammaproteobacteria bacterium]|nr:30S ribosomal protein S5 [Gammaproteobacteria bacterium]
MDAYDSRIVSIRRTTKVREGGRDFSFSAVAVVGDGKGQVGMGCGKGKEVTLAVQKATDNARKNMQHVALKGDTIQYQIINRLGATKVIILPGAEGTGIHAGGAMRPVFEVLGVKNVIAKSIGARNPLNVVRATIEGLVNISNPTEIAKKRGKTVEEILGKKAKENTTV